MFGVIVSIVHFFYCCQNIKKNSERLSQLSNFYYLTILSQSISEMLDIVCWKKSRIKGSRQSKKVAVLLTGQNPLVTGISRILIKVIANFGTSFFGIIVHTNQTKKKPLNEVNLGWRKWDKILISFGCNFWSVNKDRLIRMC